MSGSDDFRNILTELAPYLVRVEESLSANLNTRVELIETINRHIAASGGKRLRPILMIISARVSGYGEDRFTDLATVIEYLHSATLLHDDVLDGARLRRGNPSANVRWGNSATVLSGDFLFSRAFSILVENYTREITLLMCGAAIKMIEGEVYQLTRRRKPDTTQEDYYQIIGLKTASLLSASCEAGALLGNAGPDKVKRLADFGYDLVLAFQIVDDVLDFVADQETFGKVRANDFKEGTVTLPIIKLLPLLDGDDRTRVESLLVSEDVDQKDLLWVSDLVRETGAAREAYGEAEKLLEKAVGYLEVFEEGPYRKMLESAAAYVTSRQV